MGYTIKLEPEVFAPSTQGGTILLVEDNQTGVIEKVALFNGRASGRTAIDRRGYVYEVLPYEPAFSLNDNGEMVLSEEPLGENLIPWSEDMNMWTLNAAPLSVVSEDIDSPIFGVKADTLETDGASAGKSYLVQNVSPTHVSVSGYLKHVSGYNTLRISVNNMVGGPFVDINIESGIVVAGAFSSQTTIEDVGNGWFRIKIENLERESIGNSRVIIYNISNSTGVIKWGQFGFQMEEGSRATSYIRTLNGSTGVRLGATGVKTPDISKYINSNKGEFEITTAFLEELGTGLTETFSLSDDTESNKLEFYKSYVINNHITFRIFKDGSSLVAWGSSSAVDSIKNKHTYKIIYGNKVPDGGAYVDGVRVADWSGVDTSFIVNTLKILKTTTPSDSSQVFANTNLIKINS
ncbi:hypothetical protein ACFLSU_08020 [Bacteroidota bacterium]